MNSDTPKAVQSTVMYSVAVSCDVSAVTIAIDTCSLSLTPNSHGIASIVNMKDTVLSQTAMQLPANAN